MVKPIFFSMLSAGAFSGDERLTKVFTHKILESVCPTCGKILNGVTNVRPNEEARPVPGDFTLCIECRSLLRFGDDLQLVGVTSKDLEGVSEEDLEMIKKARQFASEIRSQPKARSRRPQH